MNATETTREAMVIIGDSNVWGLMRTIREYISVNFVGW